MQTLKQGGGFLSHCLCLQRFNCVWGDDQVEVSMAPTGAGDPSRANQGGAGEQGAHCLKLLFIWAGDGN